jgi:sugar phosphate isomerase/epimerase
MSDRNQQHALDRRAFLKGVTAMGGVAVLGGRFGVPARFVAPGLFGASAWIDQAGLQLFTVRDQIAKDFEGTLAAVAAAGYKEVEPTSYGGKTPAEVRAILDRLGLKAPSTHVSLTPGPDLEQKLAGYQAMGHKYAAAGQARAFGGGRPPGGGARPAGAPGGAPGAAPGGAPPAQGGNPPMPSQAQLAAMFAPKKLDDVRREADLYNQIGAAGKPYGVKVLIHNHTTEFQPLADDPRTQFDILMANVDPSLVVFELDIGWATVAGQDPLALIRKYPGRFPLWHVKDMADLATVRALPTQGERMRAAKIVGVGEGEIAYGPIFQQAKLAGLEHYYVEDDAAPQHGSLDVMRACIANLRKQLA